MIKIYKLKFKTPVHFGEGNLETTSINFDSHVFFSSILNSALQTDYFNELLESIRNENLLLSDSFPFKGDDLFFPKPSLIIEKDNNEEIPENRKKNKNIKFLKFEDLLKPEKWEKVDFGKSKISGKAMLRSGKDDAEPFNIASFSFDENCGLYFILKYNAEKNEILGKFEDCLKNLQYEGIGGKRSSGLGKFEFEEINIPDNLNQMLSDVDDSNSNNVNGDKCEKKYMALSSCFPKEDELESAFSEATYILKKASGFIYSKSYSNSPQRKKDFYKFSSGSIFKNKFEGDIFDISDGDKNKHRVWTYAKPMFISLDIKENSNE